MDVGGWLRGLGLEQYEAAFRENKIDDMVLPRLTAEDLRDLSVGFIGDRRKLLDAIAALRAEARPKVFEAMGTNEVVECIRPLLTRFSENEETVRRLVATDEKFDALCHQYRHVIDLLKGYQAGTGHEAEVERLEAPGWAGRRTVDAH